MDNHGSNQLYNSIKYQLLNSNTFYEFHNQQDIIKNHIKDNNFINHIKIMVENNDYSCMSVYNSCNNLLNDLVSKKPPMDWLNYIYQFVLDKSFPQATTQKLDADFDVACTVYLKILRVVGEYQKISVDNTWQSKYPLLFLKDNEVNDLESPTEYQAFVKVFNDDYVYEMMKLNQELKHYSTLDHICGVQYIALFVGRQLKKAGLPVDLARVFCSSAGHDIGKYGCKANELKRVPYLHYYYTDQWFKRHEITYAGHIAVNHSTWDLELENLSIESLILIYSDFRVKVKRDKNGIESMYMYTLEDSFDVILQKLDNLDDAKEKRYKRVYAKLKDFENFMLSKGIVSTPTESFDISSFAPLKPKYYYSLMQNTDVIEHIKYLSISFNTNLMYQLRDEYSLNLILELARSESDWKKLREYIRGIEEYSTYLTQNQKLLTIKFLYDQLIHPEADIRRQCASLIGILVATFDEDYRKEVPSDVITDPPDITSYELLEIYMKQFITPDHKIIPIHRSWIGYSMGIMISSLFKYCRASQMPLFRKIIIGFYNNKDYKSNQLKQYFLETVRFIPLDNCDDTVNIIYNFVIKMLKKQNDIIRISALEASNEILIRLTKMYDENNCTKINTIFIDKIVDFFRAKSQGSSYPSENYINLKIVKKLHLSNEIIDKYKSFCDIDSDKIPATFLSNLKTATNWIIKRAQIEFLLDYSLKNIESNGFYTAMHFCNLLKVSAVESVRNRAGDALVYIIPHLSYEQRNDVAIELIRALEIEGYQFAEYIPNYLGRIILFLQPIELDELLKDFIEKIKQASPTLTALLIRTIGVSIVNYDSYNRMFEEKNNVYKSRLSKMVGIILNGLVHYNLHVKQISFSVLGKEIFGSKHLDLELKNNIFQLTAKKMLTLITNNKNEEQLFLTNSTGLNSIYRFISDYSFFNGGIYLRKAEKIAFFPGTFDPFSLSHKEIVRAIRDLDFEVYLAVDEFSWSKRTLPNLIRRNIINMSIADELNVYLYPKDFPINIANPKDLTTLRNSFKNSNVYVVAGSDVVINASAYKKNVCENSIHTFPHIIFDRKSVYEQKTDSSNTINENTIKKALKNINATVVRLTLPPQYEDISSSQIRSYIDDNMDVSMLIDPLVQKFIYENGFYLKEPQYKSLMDSISIDIEVVENISNDIIDELASSFYQYYGELTSELNEFAYKASSRFIIIRDGNKFGKVLGFSAFHRIHSASLYSDLKDPKATKYMRQNAFGKILNIDGIFVSNTASVNNLEQILLTETLAFSLGKDYEYCIFNCMLKYYPIDKVIEVLELQGFINIPVEDLVKPMLVVNMNTPSLLLLDVKTQIKEPFKNSSNIADCIKRTRKRLQKSLTQLHPGQLLLSFNRNILYETLIKKICNENNVPVNSVNPRILGPSMCVPYGNVLNKSIVPNTVTKSLHTEKMYSPDMNSFDIGSFPYYLDLETQLKMLKSFDRPVILVDDILHTGHRIKELDPMLKKSQLKVQKIIVGLLSGRGRELMEMQNRPVDSAYFIPKLSVWFKEGSFYPFIGGDALWRGAYPERNLLPSINLILPYTAPGFLKKSSKEAIFNMSETAIENALDLLTTLEAEYQSHYERSLTLTSMGKVFITPRCPDYGKNLSFDVGIPPSNYLINDLEQLRRLKKMLY